MGGLVCDEDATMTFQRGQADMLIVCQAGTSVGEVRDTVEVDFMVR